MSNLGKVKMRAYPQSDLLSSLLVVLTGFGDRSRRCGIKCRISGSWNRRESQTAISAHSARKYSAESEYALRIGLNAPNTSA